MNQRYRVRNAIAAIGIVILTALSAACGAPAGTIQGQIVEADGQPVAEALVYLVAFDDEASAQQTAPESCSEELMEALVEKTRSARICGWTVTSTSSGPDGRYSITDVAPGWYKLTMRWEVDKEVGRTLTGFDAFKSADGMLVMYTESALHGHLAVALGKPFNLPKNQGVTVDVELEGK